MKSSCRPFSHKLLTSISVCKYSGTTRGKDTAVLSVLSLGSCKTQNLGKSECFGDSRATATLDGANAPPIS